MGKRFVEMPKESATKRSQRYAGPGKEDEPLKALLFAHSDSARPLRTLLPPHTCLASLPLLNIPIIAYQLDALVRGGVSDVTILSPRDDKTLQDILEPTVVGEGPCGAEYDVGGMKVRIWCDEGWHSDGDAVREVDGNTDLRPHHDFLIVSAGAVMNLNIQALVKAHKDRRKNDRSWMMTSVFRRGGQGLTRSTLTIVSDRKSNTLLKYTDSYTKEGLLLDTSSTVSSSRTGGVVDIFTDIVDCGIDICSPEMLVEFRENPDYDRLRDYVRTKLEGGEAEILGNRICIHLLNSSSGEYAALIDSVAAYDSLAGDVLAGWLSPLTPDLVGRGLNLRIPSVQCLSKRNQVYISFSPCEGEGQSGREELAHLRDCVISSTAEIGAGTEINNSVIGPQVTIGAGTEVSAAHLMSNVEVRHGASIRSSIVGMNGKVGRQCVIPEGCVLGANTKIGSHFRLKTGTWVAARVYLEDTRTKEADWDSDSTDSAHEWDEEEVGHRGIGMLVPAGGQGDPYSDYGSALWGLRYGSGNEDSASESGYEIEIVNGSGDTQAATGEEERFLTEVRDDLQRAMAANIDVDNLALEINSLKLMYHRSVPETCFALVRGILEVESMNRIDSSRAAIQGRLKEMITDWKPLLDRYEVAGSEEAEASLIENIGSMLKSKDARPETFDDVLQLLYEKEVIGQEGASRWRQEEKDRVARGKSDEWLLDGGKQFFERLG